MHRNFVFEIILLFFSRLHSYAVDHKTLFPEDMRKYELNSLFHFQPILAQFTGFLTSKLNKMDGILLMTVSIT